MNTSIGQIYQLNCSDGGVPKTLVGEAMLTSLGLVGDRQAHTRFHGGPERALCLYALEVIQKLQREGHPITPGSTGENVTVEGFEWSTLVPGCRLALGDEAIVEITSYTVPCKQIAASFMNGDFKRISQKLYAGEARLYARVIRSGHLAAGQTVRLLNGT